MTATVSSGRPYQTRECVAALMGGVRHHHELSWRRAFRLSLGGGTWSWPPEDDLVLHDGHPFFGK
jgi:hypothetical protein